MKVESDPRPARLKVAVKGMPAGAVSFGGVVGKSGRPRWKESAKLHFDYLVHSGYSARNGASILPQKEFL